MPSVGGVGTIPRLKVPIGLQEFTQHEMARKSLNLPHEQFLISGGSIDKYLKNNLSTPKGTQVHSLATPQVDEPGMKQHPANPSAGQQPPSQLQPVPVMSNLIIAMAL